MNEKKGYRITPYLCLLRKCVEEGQRKQGRGVKVALSFNNAG